MDIMNYIVDNAYGLIPVLLILGSIMKNIEVFPDKYIPIALLPVGILGAVALMGFRAEAVIQGVLLTGAAVFGNQIYKQIGKAE
ncbi:MAG: phage holin family protein [Oscillospiraceae bacterium]|jgi:hypothetical protein|nr:phage holin family protein [Oscillospiraceae bacterium]